MIPIKSSGEVKVMEEGGRISAEALVNVLRNIRPGVKLSELDRIAEKCILSRGSKPSFKMVYGYKYTTCINVNEGLVHGIPTSRQVKKGDLVKVDLGAYYKGFNTDISYTVEVETAKYSRFLEIGKKALSNAINKCVAGNRIGDISAVIQKEVESGGFSVSRELIGHGVGRNLHEDPEIPGFGEFGTGPKIKNGMVFALEVIYQTGKPDIAFEKDGWTIITKDGSMAGLFEHTVAICEEGPKILTSFDYGLQF